MEAKTAINHYLWSRLCELWLFNWAELANSWLDYNRKTCYYHSPATIQLYLLPWKYLKVNNMEDDNNDVFAGETVEKFRTYEDFLDSQIKPLDLFYLEVTHQN